jgi:hypothetical protein
VLDSRFVLLGAVIGGVGQAYYVRDTLRGTTQPNRVSYVLWALAPLIAFAVERQDGVGWQSLMTFMVGFGPLMILAASFANPDAVWRITRFDYVCGGISLLGTIGWLLTRHGAVALFASIAADGIAGVPTIVKSWRHPSSESGALYVGGVFNGGITLLTVDHFTASLVAFPLYIFLMAGLVAVLVLGRVGPRVHALAER